MEVFRRPCGTPHNHISQLCATSLAVIFVIKLLICKIDGFGRRRWDGLRETTITIIDNGPTEEEWP
jgi:hypothetical protein